MEESKDPRQEGSQDAPGPSGMETVEPEPGQEPLGQEPLGQEPLATGELPAAEGQPEEARVLGPPVGPALDRRRYLVPGAFAVAVVAFAAVGIFVLGMFTHSRVSSGGGQLVVAAQATPTAGPVEVSADDSPSLGPENASVTIIEFGDFECSACGQFQSQTLPQILSNYGDRVRFVYRNFPITQHQHALKAAEAAECANAQGAFWKYHDLLFQNQSALDDASLKNYAASLGLDTATFNQCLDSDSTMSEVQKDYQDGIAAGVNATPSFFILVNGVPLTLSAYSTWPEAIEAALKQAGG